MPDANYAWGISIMGLALSLTLLYSSLYWLAKQQKKRATKLWLFFLFFRNDILFFSNPIHSLVEVEHKEHGQDNWPKETNHGLSNGCYILT